MLSVNIICIGKLKEKYLTDGCNEYIKRLRAYCDFKLIELSEYKVSDNPSEKEIEICLQKEGEQILKKIPKGSFVIPMCIEGESVSSEDLAKKIKRISDGEIGSYNNLSFIIGGSFGLWNEIKKMANFKLSMSKMTFPHQLARMMLLEQIYRAFSINANSKYHK